MKPVDFFLIRGLAREGVHWGDFTRKLKEQKYTGEVLPLDLPGAGRYHKLTSPLTISENAEFLLSHLPREAKRPRVILSISLGSMIALEMAKKAPDLFQQIYVMNTSLSNLSPIHHRLQLKALRRMVEIILQRDIRQREIEILKMVSQKPQVWDSLLDRFVKAAVERPMSIQNVLRQLIAASIYKVSDAKPSCSIQVLNSCADEMVDPSCSEKLAKHWNLALHTHPSAGHDIAIDAPEWILEILAQTLD